MYGHVTKEKFLTLILMVFLFNLVNYITLTNPLKQINSFKWLINLSQVLSANGSFENANCGRREQVGTEGGWNYQLSRSQWEDKEAV